MQLRTVQKTINAANTVDDFALWEAEFDFDADAVEVEFANLVSV